MFAITEVHMQLEGRAESKVRAYATVVLDDCFVVHDLKVLDLRGRLVTVMPQRPSRDLCPKCSAKNDLHFGYCHHCGTYLGSDRIKIEPDGERSPKRFDVAHPISRSCRALFDEAIFTEYRRIMERTSRGRQDMPLVLVPASGEGGAAGSANGDRADEPRSHGSD
jgi:stage V sporulation protein G